MTARSDFVADPAEFMKKNIVAPQFRDAPGAPTKSRPIVITIVETPGKRCSRAGGKVYHFTRNVAGVPRDEKLPIYWLAYQDDSFTQGVLNNQSRVMFTALMNGCTLGFGSQTGDGGCLVSHANLKSAKGGEPQRAGQQAQLTERFAGTAFDMVEPENYRSYGGGNSDWNATNFGVNNNGTWEFYTHRFKRSAGRLAGVMFHGGVNRAVTTPG